MLGWVGNMVLDFIIGKEVIGVKFFWGFILFVDWYFDFFIVVFVWGFFFGSNEF